MPTHCSVSIHFGPCLDQHQTCGLVAIQGSAMERGVPGLWGDGGMGGWLCGKGREEWYIQGAK